MNKGGDDVENLEIIKKELNLTNEQIIEIMLKWLLEACLKIFLTIKQLKTTINGGFI